MPTSKGYELTISNLSLSNLPVSIESFPLTPAKYYLTVKCGEDEEISQRPISLSSEYFLSVFSLCDKISIYVQPNIPGTGLWLRCHDPFKMLLNNLIHFLFFIIISFSLYFLFKNGENNSFLRSILITQTSILLILNPFKYLIQFFPKCASLIHIIISSVGWWRATFEIFSEYGVLIRHNSQFYRTFSAIPTIILIAITFSEKFPRFNFPSLNKYLGVIGGFLLPFSALAFLIKARKINGRNALFVHVISGTICLSVWYFMKLLRFFNEEFKNSFICEFIEVSFVGCYALFETVFQSGEGTEENEYNELKNPKSFCMKTHTLSEDDHKSGIKTIDGMLEIIPANGEDGLFVAD